MPIQFPSNPVLNDTYVYPGLPDASVYWQWNGFGWAFKGATGSVPEMPFVPGQSETVLIQSYENSGTPLNPDHGALWFNTDTGVMYTYLAGETGAFANAWVQATVINNTIQALPS